LRRAQATKQSNFLLGANCRLDALITASVFRDASCSSQSRGQLPGFVERPRPIRKTVLGAPPPVHRRPAPSASEAADINTRLPFLRSVVNRLARQATEKDTQWSLVGH
jgi:hypothetical protein